MTQQGSFYAPGHQDAGGQVARLRHVLALIEELAGSGRSRPEDAAIEEAARISAAYAGALPIDQKRFDRFAADTARWAGAGLEALLKLDEGGLPVAAAAQRLGEELERAIATLAQRLPG